MSHAADNPFQIHRVSARAAAKAAPGGTAEVAKDLLDETVHVRRQSQVAAAPVPAGHGGGGSELRLPIPAGRATRAAGSGSAPAVVGGAQLTAKAAAPQAAPSAPPKAAPPSPSFAFRFPDVFGFGQGPGRREVQKEAHTAKAGASQAKAPTKAQQILQEVQTAKAKAAAPPAALAAPAPAAAPVAPSPPPPQAPKTPKTPDNDPFPKTPDNDPFLTHTAPAQRELASAVAAPAAPPNPFQVHGAPAPQPAGTMLPPSLMPDERFKPQPAFPGGGAPGAAALEQERAAALRAQGETARLGGEATQQQRPTYGTAPSLDRDYKMRAWPKGQGNGFRTLVGDVGAPLLLFFVASLMFAFWWDAPPVPVVVTLLGLAVSLRAAAPRHPEDHTLCDHLPMLIVKFAAVFGALTGVYAYEAHSAYYYAVSHGADYRDVLASSPGAAYADAGSIKFAPSSRVDTSRAWGHEDQHRYCAAPIVDDGDAQTALISFWAVGVDCCGHRAEFACGDVDGSSQAGVRLPPDGLFSAPHADFLRAINRSAVVFGLQASSDPILLHWVADTARPTSALLSAAGVCLLGVCLFGLLELTAYVTRALVREDARRGYEYESGRGASA